jgi:hypothetical protein
MALLALIKYSATEKRFAEVIQPWLIAASYAVDEQPDFSTIKKLSFTLLDRCIAEAKQKQLRNVQNLGDIMLRDKEFVAKRLSAGLTEKNIREAWNPGYVWVRLQEEVANACNFPIYKYLVENQGLKPDEAVKLLRHSKPFFGDPETSNSNYQGEDADLYFEFRKRFDQWREKYSSEQIVDYAKEYSTYNAMVRHFIRIGEI